MEKKNITPEMLEKAKNASGAEELAAIAKENGMELKIGKHTSELQSQR